ncbi:antibiotic biosynthesis monooxygenase [Lentzea atacamensis]|uniref:Antibiotic biosynthesis monooxygenase n=1 Tax=Lentzea atacamensis TaxID=531938 RepID=A0A316IB10_9PSEU|nr:antibiotic biosynthesis monooxygenase family protein [Lentzea atacamensis]PWK89544.1 antibiotic biosynthesis monooxygenase [Lentzea atacamensis]
MPAAGHLPDVIRPDAGLVVISPLYVGGALQQKEVADEALARWTRTPVPQGLLSMSVFASLDGEALLAYAQWTGDDAYAAYLHTAERRPLDLVDAVRYRLHRSMNDTTGEPGCVITAAFDVDGPERQRHIVDALADAASRVEPFPGALSAHFHLSVDGTRVLNYAEWTSLEAHDRAVENAELDEIYRISLETPGVRPTRGRAYHLHGALHAN